MLHQWSTQVISVGSFNLKCHVEFDNKDDSLYFFLQHMSKRRAKNLNCAYFNKSIM